MTASAEACARGCWGSCTTAASTLCAGARCATAAITYEEGIEERIEAPERTDAEFARREESREIRDALRELPQEQSRVIELAYFGGLTHIADRLDARHPRGHRQGTHAPGPREDAHGARRPRRGAAMSPREEELEGCAANAAPYVLGALPEEDCELFRGHLESCAVCREEVAALQLVADALPSVVPRMEPPPELKAQLMATVREEAERSPRAKRAAGRVSFASFGFRPAVGLAGALAVLVLAAIAVLSGGSSSGGGTRVISAEVLAPHATASVRLNAGHAELKIAGMPQSSPNRVYEVWVQRGGAPQPTNALFTVTSAGRATVGVPGNVAGVKQILVTSEPLGGSRVPTRAPVIVAKLS